MTVALGWTNFRDAGAAAERKSANREQCAAKTSTGDTGSWAATMRTMPRPAKENASSSKDSSAKRRKELKDLFAGCKAGHVFVTAFETRRTMQPFVSHIAWESEVWIAEDPDQLTHFNGERFLGPYPDVMPTISARLVPK